MMNNSVVQSSSSSSSISSSTTVKTKYMIGWHCEECKHDCLTVREECRCICGHRMKEHSQSNDSTGWKCKSAKCKCHNFFYIVAEGSWILRCRCKHKHIEHDPSKNNYPCVKAKCQCVEFDSPFVCNCNHGWKSHKMRYYEKQFTAISQCQIEDIDVGDPTLLKRGSSLLPDDE